MLNISLHFALFTWVPSHISPIDDSQIYISSLDTSSKLQICIFCLFVCFVFFAIFWAAFMAYGGSQARGPIGAVATDLHHSHSNAGSESRLQPTPQLTATPDP